MHQLGLIGFPLSHSFSKSYFSKKFAQQHIDDWQYDLFPLPNIEQIEMLISTTPNLIGLNVTLPYKQSVIPYLHQLEEVAIATGAVNTILFEQEKRIGYNTDVAGFAHCLQILSVEKDIQTALVLGNGGSSKEVKYVLAQYNIAFMVVSRSSAAATIMYDDLDANIIAAHQLIINTTPLGMLPYEHTFPLIPYEYLTPAHVLFDLVYNPAETVFLQKGKAVGCVTMSGLPMLYAQADAAWDIWQKTI